LSKVANFNPPHLHLSPPFEFRRELWRQKTIVTGLSYGVVCVILRLAVLIQYRSVTDTHTDGRTDRHTTTAYTALSIASRAKNRYELLLRYREDKRSGGVVRRRRRRQLSVERPAGWYIATLIGRSFRLNLLPSGITYSSSANWLVVQLNELRIAPRPPANVALNADSRGRLRLGRR